MRINKFKFSTAIVLISLFILVFSASCSGRKPITSLTREDFAPLKLGYVDFRVARGATSDYWGKKIGEYNFKLFGCTRKYSKDVMLDAGRAVQRNMRFFETFFEQFNDFYPVITSPENPYYMYSDKIDDPEYILLAEIRDAYLNVCDHYDWRDSSYPELRSGRAEMEVVWRLVDLTKTKTFWKGVTNGYSNIDEPVRNGEVELIEKAFADALERMRHLPGFAETVANHRNKKEIEKEKEIVAKLEESYMNPKAADSLPSSSSSGGSESSGSSTDGSGVAISVGGSGGDSQTTAGSSTGGTDNNNQTGSSGWVNVAGSEFADEIVIKKQLPFDKMNAYIMYRIRTGVAAVKNSDNYIGSGLLIAPDFILTADSVVNKDSKLEITTINNRKSQAQTIRRNTKRDVALLHQEPTGFYPLPLRLDLPKVGEEVFFALGAPTPDTGEGALEDKGKVTGYRYTEGGAEIMVNTYVQERTLGGALIDRFGNILGMAHSGPKALPGEVDYFIPIASALEKLGVKIEGVEFPKEVQPEETKKDNPETKPVSEPVPPTPEVKTEMPVPASPLPETKESEPAVVPEANVSPSDIPKAPEKTEEKPKTEEPPLEIKDSGFVSDQEIGIEKPKKKHVIVPRRFDGTPMPEREYGLPDGYFPSGSTAPDYRR